MGSSRDDGSFCAAKSKRNVFSNYASDRVLPKEHESGLTIYGLVIGTVVSKSFSRPAVEMPRRVINRYYRPGAEGTDIGGSKCRERSLAFERHAVRWTGYGGFRAEVPGRRKGLYRNWPGTGQIAGLGAIPYTARVVRLECSVDTEPRNSNGVGKACGRGARLVKAGGERGTSPDGWVRRPSNGRAQRGLTTAYGTWDAEKQS
jgi:hypothetical protein